MSNIYNYYKSLNKRDKACLFRLINEWSVLDSLKGKLSENCIIDNSCKNYY